MVRRQMLNPGGRIAKNPYHSLNHRLSHAGKTCTTKYTQMFNFERDPEENTTLENSNLETGCY